MPSLTNVCLTIALQYLFSTYELSKNAAAAKIEPAKPPADVNTSIKVCTVLVVFVLAIVNENTTCEIAFSLWL